MSTTTPTPDPDILFELNKLGEARGIRPLRSGVRMLKKQLAAHEVAHLPVKGEDHRHTPGSIPRQFLIKELDQIERTRTMPRARYYLDRLKRSLVEVNTRGMNDINLNRWKEYDAIRTDSLWLLDRREGGGGHSAWYWGNFVPEIPRQLLQRYTKRGEWVLDGFAGSGTTLLESRSAGRHCLGLELQASVARRVRKTLRNSEPQGTSAVAAIEVGDSKTADVRRLLEQHGGTSVQLAILHPPYHNIIRFSKNRKDLSNASTPEEFTRQFGLVVDNVSSVLDSGRMLAVVIGDKYEKGEWIPLGFMAMSEVMKRDFRLKSIVVKNFEETTGKRNQKMLWRFRALAGGFYVFKHEYIFIFQKS